MDGAPKVPTKPTLEELEKAEGHLSADRELRKLSFERQELVSELTPEQRELSKKCTLFYESNDEGALLSGSIDGVSVYVKYKERPYRDSHGETAYEVRYEGVIDGRKIEDDFDLADIFRKYWKIGNMQTKVNRLPEDDIEHESSDLMERLKSLS